MSDFADKILEAASGSNEEWENMIDNLEDICLELKAQVVEQIILEDVKE